MAVLEVGLIAEGLPVIKRDYQELAGVSVDPVIKSGLFSAINAFTREVFGDSTEELKLKKYIICIKPVELTNGAFFLYAIVDKSTKTKAVTSALDRISTHIAVQIEKNDITGTINPDKFIIFHKMIDEEMRDLRLRPADRAKKLFG
ncbi:MAG: hypothetical protein ACTSP4_07760 [Candidatus Hodarchaeales archaeon]